MENTTAKYERALKRVNEIKEFYNHLGIYIIFVCIFIGLNSYTSNFFWAIFPILGWGIGILSHASKVYQWNPLFSKDWERRKIDQFMKNEDL